jgi:uncharacterized protein (TIGR00251 family)
VKISVKVKPKSSKNEVVLQEDGSYLVRLTSPPVEGKANYQLLELLAEHFNKPKRGITILKGMKGHLKVVEIL